MSISKRLRFQVFRRDGYACHYCGRRAPHVTLEVDHRLPRCQGGSDHPDNLVSACWDCNRGKGPLDDGDPRDRKEREQERFYEWWWGEEDRGIEDRLPRWLSDTQHRTPLILKFDIHKAADELAPACMIYADTLTSVLRRADAFTPCVYAIPKEWAQAGGAA